MAIFQKSVLNKFIKSQDAAKIEAAYKKFCDTFLQPDRQVEIRSMKEEEYQDGFLDDLFVNILGYIKRPNTGFNLVREKKNEADSKKADGAILKNDMPLAVIELKGTDTTDLDKVTNQGFGYKNNHKECVYVVISNFEKLRFFIHHAVDYIEFNLFTLSKEEFTTLWLCLHSENLLDNVPAKIKEESVVKENDITKSLYKDYSTFKQELWQDIVKLNPNGDPLQFYKKTQKLIDRFLFIFFAEDAGLLPPNSISRMVERWKMLKEEDAYKPLYEIFKQYFGYINTGRPGKTPQDEIFAYNGGLMLEDDVLESIIISDEVLLKHVSKITTYDFSSEVDVNILGHIFENSLNDIEAVTAELEGQEIDKSKTKRKKDGVFYTPKYITKYIVDNTVGKLCDEKKLELNIIDEEYAKGRSNRKKETLKQLDENLQAYRNWLLNITICDPACGSGAFLNQALEYLMEEHCYIDELESQLLGAGFTFPGVENHILENNIFGVDINEESIEIAKLSLWLRTAKRGRKLTSLNNNIKCGNSIIDDPEISGDKAFSWEREFPTVFEKGGFDVIIGNPPYGAELNENEKKYVQTNYPHSTIGKIDSYRIFIEHSTKICKKHGLVSYIIPNTFMYNVQSFKLRKFLLENCTITDAVELRKNIFEDAPDVVTVIFSFGNYSSFDYCFRGRVAFHDKKYSDVNSSSWAIDQLLNSENLKSDKDQKINLRANVSFDSINEKLSKLDLLDNNFNLRQGTKPYGTKSNKNIELISKTKYDSNWEEAINGRNISRYHLKFEGDYVKRSNDLHSAIDKKIILEPKIYFQRMRKISMFPRVVASFDDSGIHGLYTCSVIWTKENGKYDLKFLLGLLNSLLINVWYKFYDTDIEIKLTSVKHIPLPQVNTEEQTPLILKVNQILGYKIEFENLIKKFSNYFTSHFQVESLSGKLSNWHELKFNDFIKEIKKLIKGTLLTKKDEFEWMELFEENKKHALELKSQIDQTDKEIDYMVYELYGLTQEEIQIVENN